MCIKNSKTLDSIGGIFWADYDYNFNLCSFFEKMTSFSQLFHQDLEQGKLMEFIDSWK